MKIVKVILIIEYCVSIRGTLHAIAMHIHMDISGRYCKDRVQNFTYRLRLAFSRSSECAVSNEHTYIFTVCTFIYEKDDFLT